MQLYQTIPICHLKRCQIAQVKIFQEKARCMVLSTVVPCYLPRYKNHFAQMERKGRRNAQMSDLAGIGESIKCTKILLEAGIRVCIKNF